MATQTFSSLHRFSMGLSSGDWLGHSRTLMCFFLSHSFVALAVCFGSLSCWNTHPRPISECCSVIPSPWVTAASVASTATALVGAPHRNPHWLGTRLSRAQPLFIFQLSCCSARLFLWEAVERGLYLCCWCNQGQ